MTLVAWISAAALAVVLVTAARIDALRGTPRSRWPSFAGGVAITYVFLRLLPELTRAHVAMKNAHPSPSWLREHLLFLVALAGAAVLFGVERAAKRTKERRRGRGEEPRSAAWVFWLHTPVMAAYAALIGYMLFREGEQRARDVAVFGGVMALHFSGLAVALADDYRSLYTLWGRWTLAAAVLVGAVVGYAGKLPDHAFHLLLSAVAGMVIFSVIKEEIPPEQQSRFLAVAAGIVVCGGLLWLAG